MFTKVLCEGCRQLGVDCFAACDLCLNLKAAVFLLFYFGERDGQVGNLFWGNDGEVLHILCLAKSDVAIQSKLKEFLNHLNDANPRCDGMSREVCLIDWPLGTNAELKGREAFFLLLRDNCIKVFL